MNRQILSALHSPLATFDRTDALFLFGGILAGIMQNLPDGMAVSHLRAGTEMAVILATYNFVPDPRKPSLRHKLNAIYQQVKVWRASLLRFYAPYKRCVGPLARYALGKGVKVALGYIIGRILARVSQGEEERFLVRFVRDLIEQIKHPAP